MQRYGFASAPISNGGYMSISLWKITDLGNGCFSIINKNSNKALGIKNGDIVNGNNIDQYDFHEYDNQQWKFEEVN